MTYLSVSDFKSDVTVPVDDSTDALTRWDSYENFGKAGELRERTGRFYCRSFSKCNSLIELRPEKTHV